MRYRTVKLGNTGVTAEMLCDRLAREAAITRNIQLIRQE